MMESFDPGSAEPACNICGRRRPTMSALAVEAAKRAGEGAWKRALPRERGRILHGPRELIRENGERLAIAEVLDSGKTISEARGDVARRGPLLRLLRRRGRQE